MVFGQIRNPAYHNPRKFSKVDKDFVKILDFKDIKFPVKTRDIYKTFLSALAFLVMKIRKYIQSMY